MTTTAPTASASAQPNASAERLPNFKHIFVIVLENKEYQQVIGKSDTPYLNSLAQEYGLATNYYGVRHPSLPNYLALTGGSTFGVKSDCTDCFLDQHNIVDQLETGGKTWKAYIESMPSACFVGDAPPLYRQKHNPFIYYDNIRTDPARCQNVVPFADFARDLAANSLPDFIWITPNMCDDSHDCPAKNSDAWLKTWVPQILAAPAWKDQGVLFVTYDEGKSTASCCQEGQGGHIGTLVISPLGRPGYQSPQAYDHYSLLRTIEDAWGLPALNDAGCDCSPPMRDFFVSPDAAQR